MATSGKGETADKPTQPPPSSQSPTSPLSQISSYSLSSGSCERPSTASIPTAFDRRQLLSDRSTQSQETSSVFNTPLEASGGTHGLGMQSHNSICNDNVDWEMFLTDGTIANTLPLFNAASVPWTGYPAPVITGNAQPSPFVDTDPFAPGVLTNQDIDRNLIGVYENMRWFGK